MAMAVRPVPAHWFGDFFYRVPTRGTCSGIAVIEYWPVAPTPSAVAPQAPSNGAKNEPLYYPR